MPITTISNFARDRGDSLCPTLPSATTSSPSSRDTYFFLAHGSTSKAIESFHSATSNLSNARCARNRSGLALDGVPSWAPELGGSNTPILKMGSCRYHGGSCGPIKLRSRHLWDTRYVLKQYFFAWSGSSFFGYSWAQIAFWRSCRVFLSLGILGLYSASVPFHVRFGQCGMAFLYLFSIPDWCT
jgi:hypothetical protein